MPESILTNTKFVQFGGGVFDTTWADSNFTAFSKRGYDRCAFVFSLAGTPADSDVYTLQVLSSALSGANGSDLSQFDSGTALVASFAASDSDTPPGMRIIDADLRNASQFVQPSIAIGGAGGTSTGSVIGIFYGGSSLRDDAHSDASPVIT